MRQDRSPLPAEQLRERVELVQWLRGELAAVEALLASEYDRVSRSAAPAVPGGAPATR